MEVAINRDRQAASIRVSDMAWEKLDKNYGMGFIALIKHELIHIITDPIFEEYTFQMELLPRDRRLEYMKRLQRQQEKVVEHLATIL